MVWTFNLGGKAKVSNRFEALAEKEVKESPLEALKEVKGSPFEVEKEVKKSPSEALVEKEVKESPFEALAKVEKESPCEALVEKEVKESPFEALAKVEKEVKESLFEAFAKVEKEVKESPLEALKELKERPFEVEKEVKESPLEALKELKERPFEVEKEVKESPLEALKELKERPFEVEKDVKESPFEAFEKEVKEGSLKGKALVLEELKVPYKEAFLQREKAKAEAFLNEGVEELSKATRKSRKVAAQLTKYESFVGEAAEQEAQTGEEPCARQGLARKKRSKRVRANSLWLPFALEDEDWRKVLAGKEELFLQEAPAKEESARRQKRGRNKCFTAKQRRARRKQKAERKRRQRKLLPKTQEQDRGPVRFGCNVLCTAWFIW